MPALYDVAVWLFTQAVSIFFREINQRGAHLIPKKGAVIFVIAPHANQFVDPMILLKHCGRRVGFLVAKKSCDRFWVGQACRALNAIPVARAQDYASRQSGTVHIAVDSPRHLIGVGTEFTRHFRAGDSIQLSNGQIGVVETVQSDTAMLLAKPFNAVTTDELKGLEFKHVPHLDQGSVYSAVHARLDAGECIGIFPEGGSHDRAEMLPLKAGVAIMALSAAAAQPTMDLKIVPCGLNYFHPNEFRSRAVIEFGTPITLDGALVEDYKRGGDAKRSAIGQLLQNVGEALRAVTVNAPDYETLQVIQAARRLYKPTDRQLPLQTTLRLTRRFAEGYSKMRENPEVQRLAEEVHAYNVALCTYGIRDHEVGRKTIGGVDAVRLLVARSVRLLIWGLLTLPGLLLNAPIAVTCIKISEKKAKEALKASTVKIAGNDVLATWKLMVALVMTPIVYGLYAVGAALLSRWTGFPTQYPLQAFVITFTSLPFIAYASIRFGENGADIYRSLKPLWRSLITREYSETTARLAQMRSKLRTNIIQLVDELGPKVFPDFHRDRVIAQPRRKSSVAEIAAESESESAVEEDWLAWSELNQGDLDDIFFFAPKHN